MLQAFLAFVHPAWRRDLEVPVVGAVRGVVDCALGHPARPLLVASEIQSEIRAELRRRIRRSSDKAVALGRSSLGSVTAASFRVDAAETSRLLVLRSTVGTRAAVRDLQATFAAGLPGTHGRRPRGASGSTRGVARAGDHLGEPAWPPGNDHGRAASVRPVGR